MIRDRAGVSVCLLCFSFSSPDSSALLSVFTLAGWMRTKEISQIKKKFSNQKLIQSCFKSEFSLYYLEEDLGNAETLPCTYSIHISRPLYVREVSERKLLYLVPSSKEKDSDPKWPFLHMI